MKKILVIYYSQSGQILDICKSIFNEKEIPSEIEITYKEIKAIPEYPFPWTANEFFDVFPESVGLKPCQINNSDFNINNDFDLIVLAGQVWYLSPSIPITSFLKSEEAGKLLKDKPIVTVYGVRNMWVNAHSKTKNLINEIGGKIVGNIVLSDKNNNLVSVITIVRWLINGQKEAKGIWPAAGVSKSDIENTGKFGKIIYEKLINNNLSDMQKSLVENGAIEIDYAIMKTELNGGRIFNIWYTKILKEGNLTPKQRKRRLNIFKNYLYFVIFGVSPFASLFFKIKKIIFNKSAKSEIKYYSS
jgi:hypothetical protein